jgi:hypothetical protein
MIRLFAVNEILNIIRLPIANIMRSPAIDLELERFDKLRQFFLRRFFLVDRHPELANVSASDGR